VERCCSPRRDGSASDCAEQGHGAHPAWRGGDITPLFVCQSSHSRTTGGGFPPDSDRVASFTEMRFTDRAPFACCPPKSGWAANRAGSRAIRRVERDTKEMTDGVRRRM